MTDPIFFGLSTLVCREAVFASLVCFAKVLPNLPPCFFEKWRWRVILRGFKYLFTCDS